MRLSPAKYIKVVLLLASMITVLASCGSDANIGGPLPTLITEIKNQSDSDKASSRQGQTTPGPVPTGENDGKNANENNGEADGGISLIDAPYHVTPDPSAIGDDVPVSRAMAAKMLALTYSDRSTIDAMAYEITFSDINRDSWCAPYVNAVCALGLMSGSGDIFMPDEPLTLGQARQLLLTLDPSRTPGISVTEENKDKPISYALWVELYKKLLEGASGGRGIYEAFKVEGANVVTLATSLNNRALAGSQMIADVGAFSHNGLSLDAYIDKEIRIFHKNREIIALVSMIDEQPVLKNAYVTAVNDTGVGVFSGGAERFYPYAEAFDTASVNGKEGIVCDLQIKDGEALAVAFVTETVTGTLLRTSADRIEFKEHGILPLDARFKTYSEAGGAVKWKTLSNLIAGADMATYYMEDGNVRAAVITQNVSPENIRVLIGSSDYAGLIHKSVTVTSSTPFTVTAGEIVRSFEAGQRFTVSDIENTDLFGETRLYLQSAETGGTLQLTGLKRNWPNGASPCYRGVIEIAIEDGGYSLVNELPLEEYLYAVVPSEMPSSYGVEVSKVQAITARSYAHNQFYENRFHAYGAQVDDSVSCQVYNNIPENSTSIEATDATKGKCLTYNGSVISANFFSTSCGMTANSGDVWASSSRFPAPSEAYLQAVPQYKGETYDLTDENTAADFFKNTHIDAYDRSFSWFRWSVYMTVEALSESINHKLAERYQASPSLIKTWQADKNLFLSRPVETIGQLTGLTVVNRGQGGNIIEMVITGTKATVSVQTEYNIRMLLKPAPNNQPNGQPIVINRWDGSTVENFSLMPSAFFVFEEEINENGMLTGFTFYGGGYGHGVGMSQNGVKGMIDRGYACEEVLYHYFPGTEIKSF